MPPPEDTLMDSVVETRCGKRRGRLSSSAAVFKGVPFGRPAFWCQSPAPPAAC
jgi:hypothetical protein